MTAPKRAGPLPAGAVFALLSALLFGASTPFAKIFIGRVDPGLMAGLLYFAAGAGLAGLQLVRKARRAPAAAAPLTRADLPYLALAIGAGGIAAPLLLMLGLARTGAATASLLFNLEGLATMAIAWVVLGEHADRRVLAGAFAILAGAVLLSWQGPAALQGGALLIAGACLCWAVDNNLTRHLSLADPVQISMIRGLIAGAFNIALALARGASWPPVGPLAAIAAIGVLGYGVSLVLFALSLRHLGTARTSAYFSLAPFFGAALATVMLKEPLSSQFLAAGGLMALGVWLHLSEQHAHEHTHEALGHAHRHHHDAHHQHTHGPDAPPGEPHTHWHVHAPLTHCHPHYPDPHHRHGHAALKPGA